MLKELKKLFSSKLMWIVLIISMGFAMFNIFNTLSRRYEDEKQTTQSYRSFMDGLDIKGVSADELCSSLYLDADKYKQLYFAGSENMYEIYISAENAYKLAEYVYQRFPANRIKVIEDMAYELRYSADSAYKTRLFQKAIGQYNRVVPLEFKFTGRTSISEYEILNNKFSELALAAFFVMMSIRMFSMDYISGAYRLINTSLRSQRTVFFRKLLALFSVIILVTAVLFSVEIIAEINCYGLSNAHLPIQQIERYEMCPLRLSIAGYYALKYAARLSVYFWITALSALGAVLFRKALAANVVGMIFGVGGQLLYISLFFGASEGKMLTQFDTVRTFVPQSMLNISKYFEKFDCFDLFGFPVTRLFFCMAFTVGLTLCFLSLTYFKITRIEKAVR